MSTAPRANVHREILQGLRSLGPEVSWGRQGRQTNLFKPKKATSLLCQSHTFKGKLVPSIHLDETQTISNLFQYYSHRNNKAQTEILLRPQNFIKGIKTCSARNPFSFCQDASFVSLPLYSSWLHCQLTRQQRFVSHELQLSRMKSEAWWSLRIFVWVSDHSRSRDDLCCADKKNCGRTEQCRLLADAELSYNRFFLYLPQLFYSGREFDSKAWLQH